MSVYRPTVRYAPEFREYVDAVFRATTLDRNQIIRAALFTAAYSKEFQDILLKFKRKDVPLPQPPWKLTDQYYWMEQNPKEREGGKDVNAYSDRRRTITMDSANTISSSILQQNVLPSENRCISSIKGREREISSKQSHLHFRQTGGIIIRLE